jgi:hypothetical protein
VGTARAGGRRPDGFRQRPTRITVARATAEALSAAKRPALTCIKSGVKGSPESWGAGACWAQSRVLPTPDSCDRSEVPSAGSRAARRRGRARRRRRP